MNKGYSLHGSGGEPGVLARTADLCSYFVHPQKALTSAVGHC